MKLIILIVLLAVSLCSRSFSQALPSTHYSNDLQKEANGVFPKGMMEIDGLFTVQTGDKEQKYLEMASEPLSENAVLFGSSIKKEATVYARIRGYKKRRSFPRFGIGLHGISGYRLRVVPSKKAVELVKNEELVSSVPFAWMPDKWTHLKLRVLPQQNTWQVLGWVWTEGEKEPKSALIKHLHKGSPGQGKASIWGTAYSGKVIQFDDLKISYSSPLK